MKMNSFDYTPELLVRIFKERKINITYTITENLEFKFSDGDIFYRISKKEKTFKRPKELYVCGWELSVYLGSNNSYKAMLFGPFKDLTELFDGIIKK